MSDMSVFRFEGKSSWSVLSSRPTTELKSVQQALKLKGRKAVPTPARQLRAVHSRLQVLLF